jgi:CheY-like chemotaxis protein
MPKVLICGPNAALRALRAELLERAGCEVVVPGDTAQAIAELRRGVFDVLVVCQQTEPGAAEELFRQFRKTQGSGRIIAIEGIPGQWRDKADTYIDSHAPQALVTAVVAPAFPIPWQHERQLVFTASDPWKGWYCSRCCWNRREPATPEERRALAARIQQEFNAHNCEVFARENWRSA